MYQIEKGIPLPSPKTVKMAKEQADRPPKGIVKLIATYIEVGESVLFPTHSQAKNLANQLAKQDKGFIQRTIAHNKRYRVWRTS